MKRKKNLFGVIILIIIVLIIGAKKIFNQVPSRMAIKKYDYENIIVNNNTLTSNTDEYNYLIPDSFEKIAENDQLELYLEKDTIGLAVKNKAKGYTWYSYDIHMNPEEEKISKEMVNYMKSGISVITYDKFSPGKRTIFDENVNKTYENIENGFKVAIDFLDPKIKFDLVVKLQGGDLITSIPRESIEEYNEKLWSPGNNDISMNEIIIYPFFGATKGKENGYIVIPDGSGATVKLDEVPKYATGYVAPVYGKDLGYENSLVLGDVSVKPLENISLPIYGIIHDEGEEGVLVIAENGASYATYNYVSKNITTDYYQSYFSYNYRTAYSQFQSRVDEEQHVLGFQKEPNKFDLVQRYVFLNEDMANYVGVAKGYRTYLTKKYGFSKQEKITKSQIPLKIDFINNEIQMGILSEENVEATTYEQAKDIVQSLIESGKSNLDISFKTFVKKQRAYRFDVFSKLGGDKKLNEALEYFEENNINFSYYMNYAMTNWGKTKYTASKMSRQYLDFKNDELDILNYLNDPKYFMSFAKSDYKKLSKYGINSISFDGFAGSLFTHYDKGVIGYSNQSMEYIKDVMNYLHDNNIKTNFYGADSYLYPYMDNCYKTPINSSNLMFIDKTIPLIPLVISGNVDMYSPYMNFSSNDEEVILKLIEYGIYPSFLLTGEPTYSIKYSDSSNVYVSEDKYLRKRIDNYYEEINEALKEVMGSELINHTYINDNVVMTEYANHKKIIINYNEYEYDYKNITIKGKGFVVL